MKSKNPKIQILKKGISTLLLAIMIFTEMTVLSPIASVVFAAQTDYTDDQGITDYMSNNGKCALDNKNNNMIN